MRRIEQTHIIHVSPERVWAALTDPALQAQWTGESAEYEARVGGRYKLWGDYVAGIVVECDPPHKLAQTWKPSDWTIDNSVVSFTLRKTRVGTQLDLAHENVQPEDYEGTSQGWNDFYIGAIKKLLEAEKPKRKRTALHKTSRAKKVTVKKGAASKRSKSKK